MISKLISIFDEQIMSYFTHNISKNVHEGKRGYISYPEQYINLDATCRDSCEKNNMC